MDIMGRMSIWRRLVPRVSQLLNSKEGKEDKWEATKAMFWAKIRFHLNHKCRRERFHQDTKHFLRRKDTLKQETLSKKVNKLKI